MQKWEYLHIDVKFLPSGDVSELLANHKKVFIRFDQNSPTQDLDLVEYFAQLGVEGWELTDSHSSRIAGFAIKYIFKRPIE